MGIWSYLKSVIGFKEYTDDDQAYKVVQSDRDPNREVIICPFQVTFFCSMSELLRLK